MKRINITYGGAHYSVGGVDMDEFKENILESSRTGTFRWLTVNVGEGRPQKAEILIGPGIPIAVMPVTGDTEESM
jgi:hypothetical protein